MIAALAGTAAAVLAIAANWPGIRDTLAGKFRPRPASWGPWTAALATGAAAAVVSGAWASAAYTGACAAGCGLILILGWRRRQPGWGCGELACAALALAGVTLLAAAACWPSLLPVWAATAVACAADLAAYLPTFGDGLADPGGQPLGMYVMFTAAAVLTLAPGGAPAGMIYPAYLAVADGLMCALIIGGRRRRPAVADAGLRWFPGEGWR